jgi:hypothetical protein
MIRNQPCISTALVAGALVILFLGGAPVLPAASPEHTAVALVTLVKGQATETGSAAGERELTLLERLEPGQMVSTGELSQVVITYFDGRRFRLLAETRARVGRDEPEVIQGELVALSPVAAVPSLGVIERNEVPGKAIAASRLRQDPPADQVGLVPADNELVHAGYCTLRFSLLPGVKRYQVTIEDERLAQIMEVTSDTGEIQLAPDLLQAGAEYYWEVCSLRGRRACRGAVFRTLPADQAALRAELAAQARDSGETDLLVLLAELDRRLGLHRQACEGLDTSLRSGVDQRPILDALHRFDCTQAEDNSLQPSNL